MSTTRTSANNDQHIYETLLLLKRYPQEELYRFIVDGDLQKKEKGWIKYEKRQPGSIKAVFKAFALAITNLDDPELKIDLINQLHRACTEDVPKLLDKGVKPGEFRDYVVGWDINEKEITEGCVFDLLKMIAEQTNYPDDSGSWLATTIRSDKPNYANRLTHDELSIFLKKWSTSIEEVARRTHKLMISKKYTYCYGSPSPENIKPVMIELVDNYNSTIKNSNNKMKIIIDFLYSSFFVHPYPDANTRALILSLVNFRLLIQNGFIPATFRDPNRIKFHSKIEVESDFKEGMLMTRKIANGKRDAFEFRTSDMPLKYKAKYGEMIAEFVQTLDRELAKFENKFENKIEWNTVKKTLPRFFTNHFSEPVATTINISKITMRTV